MEGFKTTDVNINADHTVTTTLERCVPLDKATNTSLDGRGVDAKGIGEPFTINSKYLIGSDGANSVTRNKVGIALAEHMKLPTVKLVHFRSKDLKKLHVHGQFW